MFSNRLKTPVVKPLRLTSGEVDPLGRLAMYFEKNFPRMTKTEIASLLTAYAEFMTLKIVFGDFMDENFFPPPLIDVCWRAHVLDTAQYAAFCREYATKPLHYDPFARLNKAETSDKIERTVNSYFLMYASWPDEKFCWKFPGNPTFVLCVRPDAPSGEQCRRVIATDTVGNLKIRVGAVYGADAQRVKLSLQHAEKFPLPDSLALNSIDLTDKTVFVVHLKKPPFQNAKCFLLCRIRNGVYTIVKSLIKSFM